MLGAHIISTYANMSYPAFVSTRIFDPINMTSTTYSPNRAAQSGNLTQSWSRDGRRIPFWFREDAIELNAGPGGVISNVEDLVSNVLLHVVALKLDHQAHIDEMVFCSLEPGH